jgi:O-acetyl-ADP-ribose deacetylase (regulator of RNase III)
VIHTVGPVWHGGNHHEDADLANCYRNSLTLAAQHGLKTIAFPAISTGVYGFPLERATTIAVREVKQFLASHPDVKVTFCCFSREAAKLYEQELAAGGGGDRPRAGQSEESSS